MTTDTRGRILSVALELFTERGYEATSLREIADRLDYTKAALYYHFRSKDEILRALLEPYDAVMEELLSRLEDADNSAEWAEALAWIVGQVLDLLDFFRLIDRNRHAVELVVDTTQHVTSEMYTRVERAAHSIAQTVAEEVRMIAALGAVTGFDDWAPTLLKTAEPTVLRSELTSVVYDMLQLAQPDESNDVQAPAARPPGEWAPRRRNRP
jgi:AcrR family transcriptional regulator